jgi:hypothetical protein
MQQAITFNNFYDGISFQHLATVLISVFTLCYGPGQIFRGQTYFYTITLATYLYDKNLKYVKKYMDEKSPVKIKSTLLPCIMHNSSVIS